MCTHYKFVTKRDALIGLMACAKRFSASYNPLVSNKYSKNKVFHRSNFNSIHSNLSTVAAMPTTSRTYDMVISGGGIVWRAVTRHPPGS